MKIIEVWTNPTKTDLKILVEDGILIKDQYLAFVGQNEGFYIVQLCNDKPMEELAKIKQFVADFINTIYGSVMIPKDS